MRRDRPPRPSGLAAMLAQGRELPQLAPDYEAKKATAQQALVRLVAAEAQVERCMQTIAELRKQSEDSFSDPTNPMREVVEMVLSTIEAQLRQSRLETYASAGYVQQEESDNASNAG